MTSGKLEQMLERATRLATQALERRLAMFLTPLEPVMILLMGTVALMMVPGTRLSNHRDQLMRSAAGITSCFPTCN